MATTTTSSTSDISISVSLDTSEKFAPFIPSGLNTSSLSKLKPVGVSLRYGINTVPTAILDLTSAALWLICDIEAWRRVPLVVKIKSTKGCTTFHGLIDGLSVSQAVGETRLQLVLKNYYQLLSEINPKLLGYNSNSVDFTRRISVLSRDDGGNGTFDNSFFKITVGTKVTAISMALPVIQGVIEVFKAMLTTGDMWTLLQDRYGRNGGSAIKAAAVIAKKQIPVALTLLNNIDTSYVPTDLKLGDFLALNSVLESVTGTRGNLMDGLLSVFDLLGCALLIGNTKAFVVPNSGFLKQPHATKVDHRAFSSAVNVVYPAQYNNLSFSDNGYRDIVGVYVCSDERNQDGVDGLFLDTPGGSGGIVGETMPMVYSFTTAASVARQLKSEQSKALGDASLPSTGKDVTTGVTTFEENQLQKAKSTAEIEAAVNKEKEQAANELQDKTIEARLTFMDDWAQLRYYQLKYSDRLGSYNMVFNPNFAPGCVGSIYLREPGAYIDHFVTQVLHEVHLHTPSGGTALTQVNFNCGRLGAIGTTLAHAGLDSLTLFKKFDAARSSAVALAFIEDTL